MWFGILGRLKIDREGLAYVVDAVIMDEVYMVYSDHAAVSIRIQWKVKTKTKGNKIKCVSKNNNLDSSLLNEFADMMCERVHTDLVSLSTSMTEVGEELKVVLEWGTENRRCWVSDEVCISVKRRIQSNEEYMNNNVMSKIGKNGRK